MDEITDNLIKPLVAEIRRRGDLQDERVASVFAKVPRHLFLPGAPLEDVYAADKSIELAHDPDTGAVTSASIMPTMVAQMLDLLQINEGDNVLEIGTGTGYTAALIRQLVGDSGSVTTMEIDRQTARHARDTFQRAGYSDINVVEGDGANGYAPRAAYDRIVSTVGVWDVPALWVRQLKPSGRLVIPIWLDGLQVIAAFEPGADGTLYAREAVPAMFVYMRGAMSGPRVQKFVGSTSLKIIADGVQEIDTAALQQLMMADPEKVYVTANLDKFDYWYGFIPFAMLHEPKGFVFALYTVAKDGIAYGLSGEGLALIGGASACFVPYYGLNEAHNYGGAEAYLEIEDLLAHWQKAERPGIAQLRMRLVPHCYEKPKTKIGKIYIRQVHYLHVWQEWLATDDDSIDGSAD